MAKTTKTSTPPTTDVAAQAEVFRDLVLWARRTGIAITDLRVGEVHAALIDSGPPQPRPRQPQSDADAAAGLYGQYGGGLLQDALERAAAEPTGDEEEDEDEGPAQR